MKKFVFCFWLCTAAYHVAAQVIDFGAFQEDTRLLKSSLAEYCYLLRQDYVIEDSLGEQYGWKKRPFFSKAHALAVLSKGELWTSKHIMQPWEGDSLFQAYKEDYRPVKTTFYVRQVTQMEPDTLEKAWAFDTLGYFAYRRQDTLAAGIPPVTADTVRLAARHRILAFYVPQGQSVTPANVTSQLFYTNQPAVFNKPYQIPNKQFIGGAGFRYGMENGSLSFYLDGMYLPQDTTWGYEKMPPPAARDTTTLSPIANQKDTADTKESIMKELEDVRDRFKAIKEEEAALEEKEDKLKKKLKKIK